MAVEKYKALVVSERNGKFIREIKERSLAGLPQNEVLIKVKYSSLNYKDALSASGNRGITRNYPHTPGIDAAGTLINSKHKKICKGDKVLVTGFDLGMNTAGGFGQYISVPHEWVVKLPKGLTLKESMIYGSAGFTAALAFYELEKFGLSKKDEILVTGATGGVGSLSVLLFAHEGYNVTAATGKLQEESFLKKLGASKIINRSEVDDLSGRGLLSQRWGGAVDTVGGNVLSTVIKSVKYGGFIAATGNVQSSEFNGSVFPFILRSVNLIGINSERTDLKLRKKIWKKIGNEWKSSKIKHIYEEHSLEELPALFDKILSGNIKGRILVTLYK